jgi:hypothetical protein
MLRKAGSKVDVMTMVQMSAETKETRLTREVEHLLLSMGVKVVYLPKLADSRLERLHGMSCEKFQMLCLEQYTRVFYLDSDIMPRCNLDFLFEMSDPLDPLVEPTLQKNLITTRDDQIANGGFFMLETGPGCYKRFRQAQREEGEERFLKLSFSDRFFDPVLGWGHNKEPKILRSLSSCGNDAEKQRESV